ncbi:inositol hexakisphosphate kinase 1-like [Babylonia areolata]|uniref:inositol hexakisphosphate kinase 1-like n=1 Tax=Babylonia areolata TaxID=304850 RepID=UPI003FD44F24
MPMSSGHMSSAVDGPSSHPSSGHVVRLTEDKEYVVRGEQAVGDKFLITRDDQSLPPPPKDLNPEVKEVTSQPLNPWGLSLHTHLLDKMRKSQPSSSGWPFLVLENVVGRFACPCILDLKVGSRLYGDDASPKKMASQSRKCNMTTSRSLGLRLCGMQVYQETTGTYKSLDKYHGRTLTDDTFYDVLRDFLHNGRRVRSELLEPILSRLHALIDCLNQLPSFRFYASSLLIMYDGLQPDRDPNLGTGVPDSRIKSDDAMAALVSRSSEKVREDMHVTSRVDVHGKSDAGETKEQGVKASVETDKENGGGSSVQALQLVHTSRQLSEACAETTAGTSVDSGAGHDLDRDSTSHSSQQHPQPSSLSLVDVRMIDFAHTTHSGFHDDIVHEGPDADYIWGLQNLTHMFTQLHMQHC